MRIRYLKKLHARARARARVCVCVRMCARTTADLEAHEGPKDAIFLGAQECH